MRHDQRYVVSRYRQGFAFPVEDTNVQQRMDGADVNDLIHSRIFLSLSLIKRYDFLPCKLLFVHFQSGQIVIDTFLSLPEWRFFVPPKAEVAFSRLNSGHRRETVVSMHLLVRA
jgi:hypothetical protein